MPTITPLKRGATFRARLNLDVGLKGWAFTSRARVGITRQMVAILACREIDVDGACIVEIEGPTDSWPPDLVAIDVRAELGGEVVFSPTIIINVLQEVTNGGE